MGVKLLRADIPGQPTSFLGANVQFVPFVRDLIELTKPGITIFCVIMSMVGFLASPAPHQLSALLIVMLAVGATVAGANTLNMLIERETDRLMRRTENRPLAARRLKPTVARVFGLTLGLFGVVLLATLSNVLTAMLAALAFGLYVLVYTPLKQKTAYALFIGAIPGAMPPLLGWTAGTHELSLAGLLLFSMLFLWQIPHFLAIALSHKQEYLRAGIRVWPEVYGDRATRFLALVATSALLLSTLLFSRFGLTHRIYPILAAFLGIAFLIAGLVMLQDRRGERGARSFFVASLLYLPLLGLSLIVGVIL